MLLLLLLLSGRPCKSLSGIPSETTLPSFLNLDKHSLTLSLKYISRGSATRPAYDKYTDPEPFPFPHVNIFIFGHTIVLAFTILMDQKSSTSYMHDPSRRSSAICRRE